MRHDKTASLGILSCVGSFRERRVGRIPRIEEGMAALFDPAVEIGGGNSIWPLEQGVRRIQKLYGGLLVHYALRQTVARGERRRGREVRVLVLPNHPPAPAHK